MPPRSLRYAICEPSGETLPPPNQILNFSKPRASLPSIGIDHTADGDPVTLTEARNRVESGNQPPKAQGSLPRDPGRQSYTLDPPVATSWRWRPCRSAKPRYLPSGEIAALSTGEFCVFAVSFRCVNLAKDRVFRESNQVNAVAPISASATSRPPRRFDCAVEQICRYDSRMASGRALMPS